jgi:ribosome-associated translation inhibitor RaiA
MATPPINIRTSDQVVLGEDTREHIQRRMERHLEKLGRRATRATVRFEDANGPRGGVDVVCRVKLELSAKESIVAEGRGSDARQAFDLAAAPAQRASLRALAARRAGRRPRQRPS